MQQKANVRLFGAIGIGIICLGCLGFLALFAAIFAVVEIPLKNNPGMQQGMKIIENDPAVIAIFGSPVKPGIIVMGRINTTMYGSGMGSLWTTISGPKNQGEANLSISKSEGGNWQLNSMDIRVDKKVVLDWRAEESNRGFHPNPSIPSSSSTPFQPATVVPTP
jgi:hypothetical protein